MKFVESISALNPIDADWLTHRHKLLENREQINRSIEINQMLINIVHGTKPNYSLIILRIFSKTIIKSVF